MRLGLSYGLLHTEMDCVKPSLCGRKVMGIKKYVGLCL